MPHIHTEPGGHDITASAYVLIEQGTELRLWLHWHKKLQQWLQFGGHVEPTEHPWSAVLHELKEESGYDVTQLHVFQPKSFIHPLTSAVLHPANVCINTHAFPELNHFHTDIAYAFITNQLPASQPDPGESTHIKAMTRSEILQLPGSEIPASVREIILYIFDTIKTEWEQVPAAQYFVSF